MIWKVIEGHLNYSVNVYGQVKNNLKGNLINSRIKNGYPYIGLSCGRTKKWFFIHRLVAIAFIPNPENKPQVNHIDGNRQNHSIENLEWCTRLENIRHAIATGLSDYKGISAKAILQYDLKGNLIKEFRSGREAGRELGIVGISKVAKGDKYTQENLSTASILLKTAIMKSH